MIQDFLEYASKCYYEGSPIISDVEFDQLEAHFRHLRVGYAVTDGIAHYFPMYSLQKCFDISEAPLPLVDCVCTQKLDGAAVSLLYVNGKMTIALTRGDGKMGRDITQKMKYLVPEIIHSPGIVQVTGEVIAPTDILNARNFASGSLGLKDDNEFKARPLTFVAYDIQSDTLWFYAYRDTMGFLAEQGFHVVTSFDSSKYPTDGLVYRLNDNDNYKKAGYTAHHPRGAFALKEQKEGVVTTLKNVIWQVGKSGVVSPVAILDPVNVGDALVSRATLHNIEYIRALNLELGCQVEVIRSGEIIPRILRRVD